MIDKFSRSFADQQISEVLRDILDESGYEKMLRTEGAQNRLDNLAELKQSVYEYENASGEETDLATYLTHIALFTSQDVSDHKDQVKLMTIHAAKGLEFPYVFLCSMNEGILPSRKTNTEMAMEEERRLAFVAITRAEEGLYLSDAEGRNFDNSPRYVSRFILDISPLYLSYDEELPDSLIKDSDRFIKRSENSLLPDLGELGLKVGDRVTHPVFKEGTITDISLSEEAIFIQFDSLASPRGIALRAARKLKKSSS